MGGATVGTLVLVGVMVAVLAVFILAIAVSLQKLSFTLGTIIVGLRAIKEQTRPVGGVLTGILEDVSGIESDLGGVVKAVGEARAGGRTAEEDEEAVDAAIGAAAVAASPTSSAGLRTRPGAVRARKKVSANRA